VFFTLNIGIWAMENDSQSSHELLDKLQVAQARFQARQELNELLAEAGISVEAKRKIRDQFKEATRIDDGTHAAIQAAVNEQHTRPAFHAGPTVRDPVSIIVGDDHHAKVAAGIDGFFAGHNVKTRNGLEVPRFYNLMEAYSTYHGGVAWDPIDCTQQLARERYDSHGRYGERYAKYTEAIQTTTWPQMLGDSITRRMLAAYASADLNIWRPIVSDIGRIIDFRTQRRLRIGGYGPLPVVLEGQTYTPLPSPRDEEASYAISKKGGLESLTMETLANDAATGAVRRIPESLGRSAAQSLLRDVFDLFDSNASLTFAGPLGSDTTSLFTTAHNNLLTSVPLAVDGLNQAIVKLGSQTAFNESRNILGLTPKFLLHPLPLWYQAAQLLGTTSGAPGTADNSVNAF
jgi:hypothetical protein